MEILNNIWVALTSENEMLVKLIIILITPFEIYLAQAMFSTILRIQNTKKQIILFVLLSTLGTAISLLVFESPVNVLVNFLIEFILIYKIFNLNILSSIFAVIFPSLVFTLLESLLLSNYLNMFNITTEVAVSTPIHRLFFMTICYSISFWSYHF